MENRNYKKIIGTVIAIVLFSWLAVNVVASTMDSRFKVLPGLSEIHDEEMALETDISKSLTDIDNQEIVVETETTILKALELKLEEQRQRRSELTDQKNAIINRDLTWNLPTATPTSSEEGFTKEDHLAQACDIWADDPDYCVKVMTGVFVADSSWCTAGVGAKNNNCGNMRPGSGKYGDPDVEWIASNNWRKYDTIRDGIYDNVALYSQLYEGTSVDYMRRYWAGGSYNWSAIVNSYL